MKQMWKRILIAGGALMLTLALAVPAFAAEPAQADPAAAVDVVEEQGEGLTTGMKAIAVALAIGIAAGGGGIGMGLATAKSAEGISRQPEAEGKIRTMMMLGLVFIETAIIYALLVVILIIFVL
jgi:F-type H+-transporting ATPase subunit c